jgi:lysozyme family protein
MQFTPALAAEYENLWSTCAIDFDADQVRKQAERVLANKAVYSGFWQVPWWFIGLCDLRECNLNPKGCLHNGELIIGTGRMTSIVPKGRGPFATKQDSIRDSLQLEHLDSETDWSVGKTLFRLEGYNGFGYRNKGVPSPYLWSHTNHYADGSWDDDPKGGKYIADHVWKADVYDKQIGACAVLKALCELDSSIAFGGAPAAVATEMPASEPQPALATDLTLQSRIARLQAALKAGGVDPGAIDGELGMKTLKALQQAQKLPATGLIDNATYAALDQALANV